MTPSDRSTSRQPTSWAPRFAALALVLFAALGTIGCGYALVGRASSLPEDIQEIYIEPLKNRTTRSQVDLLYTQAITNEFVTRRRFTVVDTRTDADAQLVGTIKSFNVRPVGFGNDGRGGEYQIQVYADVSFERVNSADNEVIWSRDNYLFRENYEVAEGVAFTALEDAAIEEVAEKFAETLVIEVLEGF